MKAAFVGKWRIVEMEQWDQDYVDMEEPVISPSRRMASGDLHFGCVNANLDWRHDPEAERVDFTFDGFDEGDEVSGRGWAKAEGKQMVGQIVFHLGEESGFKAKKSR